MGQTAVKVIAMTVTFVRGQNWRLMEDKLRHQQSVTTTIVDINRLLGNVSANDIHQRLEATLRTR